MTAHGLRRTLATISAVAIGDWPSAVDNSLLRELVPDESGKPPQLSREVRGAHYVSVRPSVPAPAPRLVAYSSEVASSLGLSAETCESDEFLQFFAGKVPEAVPCWATSYGASFAGRYGGQRGDGRAISVGQVNGLEVQLKGAGTTPFSRRFDGRAVLRSSVREFLASEARQASSVARAARRLLTAARCARRCTTSASRRRAPSRSWRAATRSSGRGTTRKAGSGWGSSRGRWVRGWRPPSSASASLSSFTSGTSPPSSAPSRCTLSAATLHTCGCRRGEE